MSTASRSPFTTLSTPAGAPASVRSSASRIGQPGSFSEGFSTNVFPQAIAIGNIHIGTIAGKLNGVMPGADADRLAQRPAVDAAAHVVAEFALQQLRDAAGELDDLEAARDFAARIREHLAVLARDEGRELVGVLLDERRGSGTARARAAAPASRTIRRARARADWIAARVSSAEASATSMAATPSAGLKTGADRPERPATRRPPT